MYKTEGGTDNWPTNPRSDYFSVHLFLLRVVKQHHVWIWQAAIFTEGEQPSCFFPL